MNLKDKRMYGITTVGEKGQVVLPADLRRELGIKTGDKLAVLVLRKDEQAGIVMVNAEMLAGVVEKFFGGQLEGHQE